MVLQEIYRPQDARFQTPIPWYPMHTHRHKAFTYRARPKVSRESYVHFSGYSLHLPLYVLPQCLTLNFH